MSSPLFRLFPTSTPILSFFFSPFILVSSASTTAFGLSAQPNFGGLAFPFLAFFPPASSISRVYGKTRKRLLKSARTSEVSQRYFERNMHWREGEKKEGVSLSRPISISRVNRLLEKMTTSSTTSSVSLIAFTFLVKLLNSSLHRSELSTPNSTPFQASFPSNNAPLRVVARQLASDLVRLGLNSQSRCVTRLVECPINPLPSPS